MTNVDINDFAADMDAYFARVLSGELLVLTEDGLPVAEIVPVRPDDSVLWQHVGEGVAEWDGKKPSLTGGLPAKPGVSLSDAIVAERDESARRFIRDVARPSREERLKELVEAGVIIPAEGKLQPLTDPAPLLGDRTVTDLLIEDRG